MRTILVGLLFFVFTAQAQNTSAPCYAKFAIVDSVSGTSVTEVSLSKPATLVFKDLYKCNCSAISTKATVIRESRPLGSMGMPGYFSLTMLQRLLFSSWNTTLKEGDRIMLEIVRSTEPSGATCKVVSSSQLIILKIVP